jgi:hypothetical protein
MCEFVLRKLDEGIKAYDVLDILILNLSLYRDYFRIGFLSGAFYTPEIRPQPLPSISYPLNPSTLYEPSYL